jgi:hypothetical protein
LPSKLREELINEEENDIHESHDIYNLYTIDIDIMNNLCVLVQSKKLKDYVYLIEFRKSLIIIYNKMIDFLYIYIDTSIFYIFKETSPMFREASLEVRLHLVP